MLPGLVGLMGSLRRPSNTKAIEPFLRASQRCDATYGGLHSALSAKHALRLFLVVDMFTPRASTGHARIAEPMSEARRIPAYRLINTAFSTFQERAHVKLPTTVVAVVQVRATVSERTSGSNHAMLTKIDCINCLIFY